MNKKFFERNLGFITKEEQKKISTLSVGIAGAGGDGGLLAERLVRFGIGKLILADPENFEEQNINRQFASNFFTIGKNKASAVGEEIKKINPDIELIVLKEGITSDNVEYFVSQADIIIDEIEYSMPELSVMLAKEARKQEKFVFMGANIGWGASILCFDPKGMTFEEYFEYNENSKTINALKYLPKMPEYFSSKLLDDVLNGKISMPSISSSVALVAALVAAQIILFVIKSKKPLVVPYIKFFDTYDFSINGG